MKTPGPEEVTWSVEDPALEVGRRRVSEVRESSGRLPPKAKYWLPRVGKVTDSACRFLHIERVEGREGGEEGREGKEGGRSLVTGHTSGI